MSEPPPRDGRARSALRALVVLLLTTAAATLMVVTAAPAAAGVAVPASATNGRWFVNGCTTTSCQASLHGRVFVSEEGKKDCRGSRHAFRDFPTSVVTGALHQGRLVAYEWEWRGNERVCTGPITRDYQYKFWWVGGDTGARRVLMLEVWRKDYQTSTWYQRDVGDTAPTCRTNTVERPFFDAADPSHLIQRRTIMNVQFTSLSYCYNGTEVWFRDTPEQRLYIGSDFSRTLQGACAGSARTDTDRRMSNIYVTCNAVFSNKVPLTRMPRAYIDPGTSSQFTIPALLNAGLNLGAVGGVGVQTGADQTRFYTLRLWAGGCYQVSGVGDDTAHC